MKFLPPILLIIHLLLNLIRIWFYKNANRIEEGKETYSATEALLECIRNIDMFWLFPSKNDSSNKRARTLIRFSNYVLILSYATIISALMIANILYESR
jgi:hypothetical protein